MLILSRKSAWLYRRELVSALRRGAVIIYPTDTIYGIGCDATNERAVGRIRALKCRESKPFSVIAPSKSWISRNCVVSSVARPLLSRLPGKYTFILPLRSQSVSKLVSSKSVGVRIPKHWFSDVVSLFGRPLVTTSVNISGEPFARSKDELLSWPVDIVIFEGVKRSSPSKVFDCTGSVAKRLR